MKAFEEWLKTQPAVEHDSNTIPSAQTIAREDRWAEKGWKAALKWVDDMFNTNLLSNTPVYNVPNEIKEELNDE